MSKVKYILVTWPECQMFMEDAEWESCLPVSSLPDSPLYKHMELPVYMVPEDLYYRVMR